MNSSDKNNKKFTSKQFAALLCVILLVSMYLVTLLVAIFDRSNSGRMFFICMATTVAVPFLTWIYIWLYGKFTSKHTIADFDVTKNDSTKNTIGVSAPNGNESIDTDSLSK